MTLTSPRFGGLVTAALLLSTGLASAAEAPDADPRWWHVTESRSFDDTVLREYEVVTKDSQLIFRIDAAVKGTMVTLMPHVGRYCTTDQQALVDRFEIVTRAPVSPAFNTRLAFGIGTVLLGGAAVGLGASGVLDSEPNPDALPAERESIGISPMIGVLGGLTIAYGSVFAGPGLVGAVKSRDSRTHIGEVTLQRSTKRDVCETVDLSGATIGIVAGDASGGEEPFANGTVDERGLWTFDLASISDLTRVTDKRAVVTVADASLLVPASVGIPKKVLEAANALLEARAWDALLNQEIASGQCSERTLAAMQTQIDFLSATSFDGGLLVEKDIFVVDGAQDLRFMALLPRTYKVWVFGASAVDVTATNARGQRQPSDEGAFTIVQGAGFDAARLVANAGETFTIRIKGRGCTALAVLME